MARRKLMFVLLLSVLLVPLASAGQAAAAPRAGTVPQAEPVPPAWTTLPDLVGYVSFAVPQCVAANGVPPIAIAPAQAPALDWSTYGAAAPLFWLADVLWNLGRDSMCRLLGSAQYGANILALLTNAFLGALNSVWKVGIFGWLTARMWIYTAWGQYELMRDWLNAQVGGALVALRVWLTTLAELFTTVLALIGTLGAMLVQLALLPLRLLGWVGGLAFDLGAAMLLAIQDVQTPAPLAETHPMYQMTRGALEALNDSSYGWLMYLLYAMAYVGFISWLARFLSASPAEN